VHKGEVASFYIVRVYLLTHRNAILSVAVRDHSNADAHMLAWRRSSRDRDLRLVNVRQSKWQSVRLK